MAHFYLSELLVDPAVGDAIEVTGSEARHAVAVARLRVGEEISIGNGRGLIATGPVITAETSRFSVMVDSVSQVPRQTPSIFLAQALAKAGRDELAVQAAVELGVDGVIPWAARRSVSRWVGSKVEKGIQKWASIIREGTKQSVRGWLPELRGLAETDELCRNGAEFRILILDPTADHSLTEISLDGRDLLLIVGPEGGIDPGEIDALVAAGGEPVRLGQNILRTSTAGPAAISVLNTRLGRW
ncbi:MAG: 16S rRNA (uracil(1498)-N(3))-methyltransferase [Cryobacterium sp.]|nr:16S rRNA (uracil(1498)-N(3))-methyltransferase [Cryobacterium sp.]MCC7127648.1 16S rRNA (uracil(1498)-N(3))-methyltransferase [Microbacteriaceae bacterium]